MTKLVGFLLLCAAACEPRLTAQQCEELLDRYTEKLLREENPRAPTDEVARRQEQARTLVRRDPAYEFTRCPALVRPTQFRCAMQAQTVDDIERCLVM